jgi:hypothetical protein
LNAELLIASKKVLQRLERIYSGFQDLPEDVKVLKNIIIKAEKEMDREAMWYDEQRRNANREYNEMMLRGEE